MLKKGFLRKKNELRVAKIDFLTAFVGWLGYSTGMYLLLFYTREMVRYILFSLDGEIYLSFSEGEEIFFSAFLAWISSLLGLAWTTQHLFSRKKIYRGRKKTQLMVEANSLTWFFFRWFTKLGSYYLFFGISIGVFEHLSFIDYWPIFVICALLLFLNQTQNWRLIFGFFDRKARVSALLGCISFAILLAALTHKQAMKFEEFAQLQSPRLELPVALKSSLYEIPKRRPQAKYFVHQGHTDKTLWIKSENRKLGLEELPEDINHNLQIIVKDSPNEFIVNLQADRHLSTGILKKVLANLTLRDSSSIEVFNRNVLLGTERFKGILIKLSVSCFSQPWSYERCDKLLAFLSLPESLTITILNDSIFLNNIFAGKNLGSRIERHLSNYPNANIQIFVDDHSTYQTFVTAHSILQSRIRIARDRLSKKLFGIPFDLYSSQGTSKEIKTILDELPFPTIQWLGEEVLIKRKTD